MNVYAKNDQKNKSLAQGKPFMERNSSKAYKKFSHLSFAFLLSTTLFSPAHGMVELSDLFDVDESCLNGRIGQKIFSYLDKGSLRRAAQVNRHWSHLAHQVEHDRLHEEKQQLFSLILEVTEAKPNEVQRAHDVLDGYFKNLKQNDTSREKSLSDLTPFLQMLNTLRGRLLQPESLIRVNKLNQLLSAKELQRDHEALQPLVKLIEDLQNVIGLHEIGSQKDCLSSLIQYYEAYLTKLLASECDRATHLHPKAILSGEYFLGSHDGIPSYRISQEMARFLLSKDEYGLSARTNAFGSHAVSFKRSQRDVTQGVHFKSNTTNTGLAVGRESAVYGLSRVLFQGGMSASALLSLNEVEIKKPAIGTPENQAFTEALMKGQTSDELFTHYPLFERKFTERDPHHVVQAGFHVEGLSLDSFIEGMETGDHSYGYDALEIGSFSEHILISALTNPTDGTPGNFMLRKEQNQSGKSTFSIVGIDNDMALEPGDVALENIYPKPGERCETSSLLDGFRESATSLMRNYPSAVSTYNVRSRDKEDFFNKRAALSKKMKEDIIEGMELYQQLFGQNHPRLSEVKNIY